MPYKEVLFSDEARQKIKKGVDTLTNAVGITLGSSGRNVLIERGYGTPMLTKDGITVAKELRLRDKFEELGAAMVRQASAKTNADSGDGSSTSAVLTQAIFNAGLDSIAAGKDPMRIAEGIARTGNAIAQRLTGMSRKAEGDKLVNIAQISANDPVTGKIVAEAVIQAGNDGAVTVDEGKSPETSFSKVSGYQIDKPLVSPYLATDVEHNVSELDDCAVLVCFDKLNDLRSVASLVACAKKLKSKDSVLIVADDFSEDFVAMAVANHLNNIIKIALVKAPEFGETRKEYLLDLAATCGCKPFGKEIGIAPQDIKDQDALSYVGGAKKAISGRDNAIIVEGEGKPEAVEARKSAVRNLISKEESDYQKTVLTRRLAKLTGGVVTIRVGGRTDTEMRERKHRIEDAVNAVREASHNGYLIGGGCSLVRAATGYLAANDHRLSDGTYDPGEEEVLIACLAPFIRILTNAGIREDEARVLTDEIGGSLDENSGYDARNREKCDMEAKGIIDPLSVTRNALLNACSCAASLLTTEAAITINLEKGEENPLPQGYGPESYQ